VIEALLLVGEDNPYSDDPAHALMHLPRGAAGDRLRRHLGLRDATYAALEKQNLCARRWRLADARARAWDLTVQRQGVIVALGVKVRRAFDVPAVFGVERHRDLVIIGFPHPSGRNLVWNLASTRVLALRLLREHAPWVPWGEAA
jgi:hypothetical protein